LGALRALLNRKFWESNFASKLVPLATKEFYDFFLADSLLARATWRTCQEAHKSQICSLQGTPRHCFSLLLSKLFRLSLRISAISAVFAILPELASRIGSGVPARVLQIPRFVASGGRHTTFVVLNSYQKWTRIAKYTLPRLLWAGARP